MDNQRFDRLARAVARKGTRRGALRALAAGLAASGIGLSGVRSAAAQTTAAPNSLAPGAACSATTQCSQAGGAVVCGDNGIAADGALNCCRQEGGACASDPGCCGVFLCIGGVCTTTGGDTTADPATTPTTTGAASGNLTIGSPCTSTEECLPSTGGSVICGDNLIAGDGALNCCLEQGGACASDVECCGNFLCENAVCGTAQFGDLGPGDTCAAPTDCSQGLGPATCGAAEEAVDGVRRCCLLEVTACSVDEECCGDLVCDGNGISGDGGFNCCGLEGVACQSDAGCCTNLFCLDGVCGPIV